MPFVRQQIRALRIHLNYQVLWPSGLNSEGHKNFFDKSFFNYRNKQNDSKSRLKKLNDPKFRPLKKERLKRQTSKKWVLRINFSFAILCLYFIIFVSYTGVVDSQTAQKTKFSIKDFSSECENLIFCAVSVYKILPGWTQDTYILVSIA